MRLAKAVFDGTQVHEVLAFEMPQETIPSDDPLAYAFGFMRGFAGDSLVEKGERRRDLAQAFIAGHQLGREVKVGNQPMPAWATKEV
jgi:hypothetical protein